MVGAVRAAATKPGSVSGLATGAGVPQSKAGEAFPGEGRVLEGARRGDIESFETLYAHYFPRVYRYAFARLHRREDAEDVTQEVFRRIAEKIGVYEDRGIPLEAWVFRIARNEVVSLVRRRPPGRVVYGADDRIAAAQMKSHADPIETWLDMHELRVALWSLTPAEREVAAFRFAAGLSVAETAASLGKREGTVRVLQYRAVVRLRSLLRAPGSRGHPDRTGHRPPRAIHGALERPVGTRGGILP